jgi:hypothetical protein
MNPSVGPGPDGRKPARSQEAKPVLLTAEDLRRIDELLSRPDTPARVVDRCRILRLSHEGVGPTGVARQVPWARQAICRLRARFRVDGISVLFDRPRGPRPRSKGEPPA